MKTKNSTHGKPSIAATLLIGIAVIAAAFAAISAVIALIMYNTEDPTSKTALLSIAAFVAAGAVGAFINRKLLGNHGSALPYLSSGAALLIFFAISLIAGGELSGGHLMSALCFAAVTVLASLLAKKKRSAGRTHRKRS